MSRVCIHLGAYDQPISNDTCDELLDMAYQCVAKEVMKTLTAKNFAVVMIRTNNYNWQTTLLNLHQTVKALHGKYVFEVVMDKSMVIASPICHKFVSGSKSFVRSLMGTMDSSMALKDHSSFNTSMIGSYQRDPKTKYFSSKCQWTFQGVVWIL